MQKLAVVYFPKINSDNINNFRKKYDPNWYIISLHITIVSPLSGISENQLIEHAEKVTKNIESFKIHLTGLSKTYDDCLFLLVKEGRQKIVNLHKKLYCGVLTPFEQTDFPFVPHITLGSYKKAYSEAIKMNFDMASTFDEVSVIKGDGLTPAEIIKSIKLHN